MASSGIVAAFIQPAEAMMRMSSEASFRPAMKAGVVSGGWMTAMALMACSRTLTSPVWAAWSKGPPAATASGPSLARAKAAFAWTSVLSSSRSRPHKPSITAGVAPASLGRAFIASILTWSFASSSRGARMPRFASLVSPHRPMETTAAARTRGSSSWSPDRTN